VGTRTVSPLPCSNLTSPILCLGLTFLTMFSEAESSMWTESADLSLMLFMVMAMMTFVRRSWWVLVSQLQAVVNLPSICMHASQSTLERKPVYLPVSTTHPPPIRRLLLLTFRYLRGVLASLASKSVVRVGRGVPHMGNNTIMRGDVQRTSGRSRAGGFWLTKAWKPWCALG
jgi:hypothetical protein